MNFIITFKEFVKNPILGILFLCLGALAYLHIETTKDLKSQITSLQQEVKDLKAEYKNLNDQFIQTLKNKDK